MSAAPLKAPAAAADKQDMRSTSSLPKAMSKLAAVPVPVWVVGATSWALVLRRVLDGLLG
jgi:hypothetical protein